MSGRPSLNSQILLGAALGAATGFYLNHLGPGAPAHALLVNPLQLAGSLFVDLLRMVLIPLVLTSVASGVASLGEHEDADRIWRWTLIYYLSTTLLAALLGLTLINLLEPGKGLHLDLFAESLRQAPSPDHLTLGEFLTRFLRGLFVNPFKAMAEGAVMPTVIFALMLGLAISQQRETGRPLREFLSQALDVILVMVDWIMRIAPLGVFALLAHLVATQSGGVFASLGLFIGGAVGGLLIHGLIVLPALLYLTTGVRLRAFLGAVQESLMTAFATCSSSATLAVTMRVATENLRVPPTIARFVLPLGATVNMDGTALYEAGAALFVANLAGIELNLLQQMLVCVMAVLASIGAPGLPSAGMVTMVMVLQSVDLPVEAIGILLPVDRLIDAVRTTVNVEGDLVGSLVISRLSDTQAGNREAG